MALVFGVFGFLMAWRARIEIQETRRRLATLERAAESGEGPSND
ncbi:MAG: hypothetical protein QGG58_10290 [Chloroflexota bacterium]|nr:hypothetical protein [Chloroflexota bacterium]